MANRGGRRTRITFEDVSSGNSKSSLPIQISEFTGSNNIPVRTATLSGYRDLESDADIPVCEAAQFGAFTVEDLSYRVLLTKYWQKMPDALTVKDRSVARSLIPIYSNARSSSSLGEKLKKLNVLMELNRILGDKDGLRRSFRGYLEALTARDRHDLILVGGYNAIDILVFWSRFAEANMLLKEWVEVARSGCSIEQIRSFAHGEFMKGNYWAVIQLLDEPFHSYPHAFQFELSAAKTLALAQLRRALAVDENQDPFLKAQIDWIRSSDLESDLLRLFSVSYAEAMNLSKLSMIDSELTKDQQQLLTRLKEVGDRFL